MRLHLILFREIDLPEKACKYTAIPCMNLVSDSWTYFGRSWRDGFFLRGLEGVEPANLVNNYVECLLLTITEEGFIMFRYIFRNFDYVFAPTDHE